MSASDKRDYLRGFGYQGRAVARRLGRAYDSALIGAELKKQLTSRARGRRHDGVRRDPAAPREPRALDRDKKDK